MVRACFQSSFRVACADACCFTCVPDHKILEFHIGDVVDPDDVGDGTVAGAGGGVDFGKKDD